MGLCPLLWTVHCGDQPLFHLIPGGMSHSPSVSSPHLQLRTKPEPPPGGSTTPNAAGTPSSGFTPVSGSSQSVEVNRGHIPTPPRPLSTHTPGSITSSQGHPPSTHSPLDNTSSGKHHACWIGAPSQVHVAYSLCLWQLWGPGTSPSSNRRAMNTCLPLTITLPLMAHHR